MEASVDPLSRGPDWMPITPKRGSFLHANSQPIGCSHELDLKVSKKDGDDDGRQENRIIIYGPKEDGYSEEKRKSAGRLRNVAG